MTVKTIKAPLNFSAIQVLNNASLSAKAQICQLGSSKSSVGGFGRQNNTHSNVRKEIKQVSVKKRATCRIDPNKKAPSYDSKMNSNTAINTEYLV